MAVEEEEAALAAVLISSPLLHSSNWDLSRDHLRTSVPIWTNHFVESTHWITGRVKHLYTWRGPIIHVKTSKKKQRICWLHCIALIAHQSPARCILRLKPLNRWSRSVPEWRQNEESPEVQSRDFSRLRNSEFTQNFWVYSEFLSFFVLYSRLLADFLSHLGKWVKSNPWGWKWNFLLLEGWKTTMYHIYTLILQCSWH